MPQAQHARLCALPNNSESAILFCGVSEPVRGFGSVSGAGNPNPLPKWGEGAHCVCD